MAGRGRTGDATRLVTESSSTRREVYRASNLRHLQVDHRQDGGSNFTKFSDYFTHLRAFRSRQGLLSARRAPVGRNAAQRWVISEFGFGTCWPITPTSSSASRAPRRLARQAADAATWRACYGWIVSHGDAMQTTSKEGPAEASQTYAGHLRTMTAWLMYVPTARRWKRTGRGLHLHLVRARWAATHRSSSHELRDASRQRRVIESHLVLGT